MEDAQRTVADLQGVTQGNPHEESGQNPKVVIDYDAFAGKISRELSKASNDPLTPDPSAGDHGQDIQAIAEAGLQFLGSALEAAGGGIGCKMHQCHQRRLQAALFAGHLFLLVAGQPSFLALEFSGLR